jgi:hypothetical protein
MKRIKISYVIRRKKERREETGGKLEGEENMKKYFFMSSPYQFSVFLQVAMYFKTLVPVYQTTRLHIPEDL